MLDRALAKDPDVRFQTAEDFGRALRAAKDPTWQGEVEQATLRISASSVTTPVTEATLPPAPPAPATVSLPGSAATQAPPRRPKVGLTLAAGLGGLLLVGAGGYATYRILGPGGSNQAQPQETLASATESPVSTPSKPTPVISQTIPASPSLAPQVADPVATTKPGLAAKEPPKESIAPAPRATPPAPQDPKFSQEALGKMDVPERKSLSNLSMSEALQIADKDPRRAVEGMLNAMAANPTNPGPYAWAVAILYENGRYSEIPPILARARRNGISRGQLASNIRFRMAMQREAMNHNIPGGVGGDE